MAWVTPQPAPHQTKAMRKPLDRTRAPVLLLLFHRACAWFVVSPGPRYSIVATAPCTARCSVIRPDPHRPHPRAMRKAQDIYEQLVRFMGPPSPPGLGLPLASCGDDTTPLRR